jgi:hypothetical protein
MTIEVSAKLLNLNSPVRASLEAEGYSTVAVLNACNSHLGKLKSRQTGEDKRGDMAVKVKSDKATLTVKPGSVQFSGVADIVNTFIAYHDAIAKAHKLANMDNAGTIPSVFSSWLNGFAKAQAQELVAAGK